jgi:hypothetical protein
VATSAVTYIGGMKLDPAKIKQLRGKAIERLEAALALIDETGDYVTSSLIERALDDARADQLPENPPRFRAKRTP